MENTGKVDAKNRKVYRDEKGRTHVIQNGKKVYVKKMFTPKSHESPKLSKLIQARTIPLPGSPPKLKLLQARMVPLPSPKRALLKPSSKLFRTKPVSSTLPARFGCVQIGFRQINNTCWFNAPLNALILASDTSNMLLDDMKKLGATEIAGLRNSSQTNSCPLQLTRKYVYSYALKLHEGTYAHTENKNESAEFAKRAFTPGRLTSPVASGRNGFIVAEGIKQLLSRCFGKESFEEHSYPYERMRKKFVLMYVLKPTRLGVIRDHFENEHGKWKLSHITYLLKIDDGSKHVACGYVCNGTKFIYDSNRTHAQLVDWGDPKNERQLAFGRNKTFYSVAYGLFVKE